MPGRAQRSRPSASTRRFMAAMLAWAEAIERKDMYTAGHARRVTCYSLRLGMELKLPEELLADLCLAAALHDVGKIFVSDAILGKPGLLTADEAAVMKTHPLAGAQLFSGMRGLQGALDGIRHHHERWDGRGYPDGLRRAEIPFAARIIAAADAYDAMTTHRPYRNAGSPERAASEIVEAAGTQLCPLVVRAFERLFDAGRFKPIVPHPLTKPGGPMHRKIRLLPSVLALTALLFVSSARAAEPDSGTVGKGSQRTASWSGGPFTASVPSPLGCVSPANPACDAYALTADLKPGARFAVAIASEIAGDDYDLYVYHPDGALAASSATASGNESVVVEHTVLHGPGPYQVRVIPFTVTPGSTYQGIARSTRDQAIEPEDPTACLELIPAALGIPTVTDLGQIVSLDVVVLLDGVSVGLADQIMAKAAESYAPLRVDLNVVEYRSVSFVGTEGEALIQQAKDLYGGVRPSGSDLVYVLTSKDLTTDGDTGLAGLADCIGGVRFPAHAFAVGEAVGIDPVAVGPFFLEVDAHPEIASHELGHLMGAHHHYANCVEGNLDGGAFDLSPCTLMFNFVDFQSLNFSLLEGAVVRGHSVQYASP